MAERQMTVLEIISKWTEEERRQHADLIMECLDREQLLNGLKGRIRKSEIELTENLDALFLNLRKLARTVDVTADQIQDIYFYLAKGKGNA
jgi:hypothetical protein